MQQPVILVSTQVSSLFYAYKNRISGSRKPEYRITETLQQAGPGYQANTATKHSTPFLASGQRLINKRWVSFPGDERIGAKKLMKPHLLDVKNEWSYNSIPHTTSRRGA
jgi:hypothetical protein